MFEMDILSSIKIMIDHAKGDRKMSDVRILSYSPKKSRDLPAPLYEDAVANNNTINISNSNKSISKNKNNNNNKSSHNNNNINKSSNIIKDSIPMAVINSQENTSALSQQRELRTEVTPGLLKKILKSTAKAKHIDPTQELALQGTLTAATETLDAKRLKLLKSSCPSMTTLALQSLNLLHRDKTRRIRLRDFPANIERLSLRNSKFEPKTFFANMDESKMDKLRVLDVGRAIYVGNGNACQPEAHWPKLRNLRELYLEGAPLPKSGSFLRSVLSNFPNLEVLDLEGTELNEDDLITIARYAPNLRELYLGQTALRDYSVHQLTKSGLRLEHLETICLCGTNVTDIGLESLVKICPSLRSVAAKRSIVGSKAAEALQEAFPGLEIKRVEITHIYAVFRDQGCDHFSLKYGPRENNVDNDC